MSDRPSLPSEVTIKGRVRQHLTGRDNRLTCSPMTSPNYSAGDPHPTIAGFTFDRYVTRKSGEVLPRWVSPSPPTRPRKAREWAQRPDPCDLDAAMTRAEQAASYASRLLRQVVRTSFKRRGFAPLCEVLGCPLDQARTVIASRMLPGMTWDNHGKWHIDHRKPFATARTQEEVAALCHIDNLWPMWAADNMKKGAKP